MFWGNGGFGEEFVKHEGVCSVTLLYEVRCFLNCLNETKIAARANQKQNPKREQLQKHERKPVC